MSTLKKLWANNSKLFNIIPDRSAGDFFMHNIGGDAGKRLVYLPKVAFYRGCVKGFY